MTPREMLRLKDSRSGLSYLERTSRFASKRGNLAHGAVLEQVQNGLSRTEVAGRMEQPYAVPSQIPDSIIQSIASNIVYSSAVGRSDLSGDDWGDIFAAGQWQTFQKPAGYRHVALGNTAWSAKTVGSRNPIATLQVRLISGRN